MKNAIYICVTPFFPSPSNWRGAYILDQVKAIQRNSQYDVVVFRPARKDSKYMIEGVTVHCFKTYEMPSYLFNGLLNHINTRLFKKAIRQVFTNEGLQHIEYIHCQTGPLGVYGIALKEMMPRAKYLLQHHDLDPFTIRNGRFSRWKPNAIYRAKNSLKLINAADTNICISTPCKDSLLAFPKARPSEVDERYLKALKPLKNMPRATPNDIFVLYNGVDMNLFNESKYSNKKKDIFRIGCIANFQELKDHKTLVKAFKILIDKGYCNMRLSLLGTGETRPAIEDFLRFHDLYDLVEWPSEVTHDKLPEYYHSLDLFVLPSTYEGFGCVYTEAYACGTPFIGVYSQGAAEVIEPLESDKWLIEPHDYKQLAYLIEHYYNERNEQHLCQPINIDILVKKFLEHITQYNT